MQYELGQSSLIKVITEIKKFCGIEMLSRDAIALIFSLLSALTLLKLIDLMVYIKAIPKQSSRKVRLNQFITSPPDPIYVSTHLRICIHTP